jgi:DNA-binding transcriptional ArsR family regulator
MPATAPLVVCPCCGGAGRVLLTGEYARTLAAIERLRGEHTGAELGRMMGVRGPAMNNRLARLEELGLVSSRRDGRRRLYRAHEPRE